MPIKDISDVIKASLDAEGVDVIKGQINLFHQKKNAKSNVSFDEVYDKFASHRLQSESAMKNFWLKIYSIDHYRPSPVVFATGYPPKSTGYEHCILL
jgi:GTP pyrophosphokinase